MPQVRDLAGQPARRRRDGREPRDRDERHTDQQRGADPAASLLGQRCAIQRERRRKAGGGHRRQHEQHHDPEDVAVVRARGQCECRRE